jgi:hypothetical protein
VTAKYWQDAPAASGGGYPGIDTRSDTPAVASGGCAEPPQIGDSAHSRASAAAAQPAARRRPRLGVSRAAALLGAGFAAAGHPVAARFTPH